MRRGVRNLARGVAAISLVIGVAACGSGSGDDAAEETAVGIDAASQEEEAAARVNASVETLVARWGGEGAFFAVVRANDLGYRTQQVVDTADTIAADGTIPGVSPEGDPLGMLTELPGGEQQSMAPIAMPVAAAGPADAAGDDTPQNAYIGFVDHTMAEMFTAGQEAVNRLEASDMANANLELGVIITVQKLGMQGYSAPQIMEAILLFDREVVEGSSLESNCRIAIRSGDGWLRPAFPPAREVGCIPVGIEDPDGEADPTSETTGADQTGSVAPAGDLEAGYRFTAVLDVSDEIGHLRYDWDGTFQVGDGGTITGMGVVSGTSAGTCESPGYEGTVKGPYEYSTDGTFDIAGQSSGDQLEIRLANPVAQFTLKQGDRGILCVDISADLALDFARLPLGGPELNLGLIVVPTSGGSTTIDAAEGTVFAIEVAPS